MLYCQWFITWQYAWYELNKIDKRSWYLNRYPKFILIQCAWKSYLPFHTVPSVLMIWGLHSLRHRYSVISFNASVIPQLYALSIVLKAFAKDNGCCWQSVDTQSGVLTSFLYLFIYVYIYMLTIFEWWNNICLLYFSCSCMSVVQTSGPYGLTLIPAWIINHIPSKVWD